MEKEEIKLNESLKNLRDLVEQIENIGKTQQQCIVDNTYRIEKKEKEIDILNMEKKNITEKLEDNVKQFVLLEKEKGNLSENLKVEIEKNQKLQKTNDDLITDKDSLEKSQKEISEKIEALIRQRKENFDRPNQIDSCKELQKIFGSIKSMLGSVDFKKSPFNIIYFEESLFENIQALLGEELDRDIRIEDYYIRDFSKILYDILEKNIDQLSKIFRLYLYSKIDIIEKDLKEFINIEQFSKNIETIKSIMTDHRIEIIYPFPFFESFSDEKYELELHNVINKINTDYTIDIKSNKITELSKIGIRYADNYIKPRVNT